MPNAAPAARDDAPALDLHGISQAAFDLIVEAEVSSKAVYERLYRRPTLPGGQSGVTVGIGYDCGQTDAKTIRADWDGKINAAMVAALASVAGLKSTSARRELAYVRSVVSVPWDAALDVFAGTSLPKYLAMTQRALPHFDELPPGCKGALVSLVYNRGASFRSAGARYAEMRQIRALMAERRFAGVPAQLRKMRRLWTAPAVRGVALRREREAKLFEQGLAALTA